MKRTSLSNSGQAVLTLLVAFTVLAIAVTGITSQISAQQKGVVGIQRGLNVEDMVTMLHFALRDDLKCATGLQKSDGTKIQLPSVTAATPDFPEDGFAVPKIQVGGLTVQEGELYDGVRVTGLRLKQIVAGIPDAVDPTSYTLSLEIQGTKANSLASFNVGGNEFTRRIPLSADIELGAGGPAIRACSTAIKVKERTVSSTPTPSGTWVKFECPTPARGGTATTDGKSCFFSNGWKPTEICKKAGYTNFLGSCKGTYGTAPYVVSFEAQVFAHDLFYGGAITCAYTPPSYGAPDFELLCI